MFYFGNCTVFCLKIFRMGKPGGGTGLRRTAVLCGREKGRSEPLPANSSGPESGAFVIFSYL